MPYIVRSMERALKRALAQFPAVVITGPRQSGKTTLVSRHCARTHRYVSLDDPRAQSLARRDPRLFLETYAPPVVLDEIQYAPSLLPYLKLWIDRNRACKGRIVLTGSQQFSLMRGVTESLAGRTAVLELLPFSWAERLREPFRSMPLLASRARAPRPLTARSLAEGWCRGSFPDLVADRKLDTALWYGAYLRTYLDRDVRSLRQVGDLGEFQDFLQALAARNAQLLQLSELARDLGVAVNTAKAWIRILEASHQVYLLKPYYRNLGKRLVKAPKLYFIDTGLLCHLLGLSDPAHALHGPAAGGLIETAVLGEILRRFTNRGRRPAVYFWRTYRGEEVDFVIEAEGRLHPVDVKLTKTPAPAAAKGLENLIRSFPGQADKGRLVCLADESFPLSRRVRAVPFLWAAGI